MKLKKNEYIDILEYYNIIFSKDLPIKNIREMTEKIIAQKLCKCIKKVKTNDNESQAIGICNKSVIKNIIIINEIYIKIKFPNK